MTPSIALILVSVAGGAGGGLASYVLSRHDRPSGDAALEPARFSIGEAIERVFVGIVAAFIVPLFLSLTQSDLVKSILVSGADADPDGSGFFTHDLFIVAGFCIVAGFAARWFLGSVARQALSLAREAKGEAAQARLAAKQALSSAAESEAQARIARRSMVDYANRLEDALASSEPLPAATNDTADAAPSRRLEPQEQAAMKALSESPFTHRTLAGVAVDTGMSEGAALAVLTRLKADGFITATESKLSRTPLYRLTPAGSAIAR